MCWRHAKIKKTKQTKHHPYYILTFTDLHKHFQWNFIPYNRNTHYILMWSVFEDQAQENLV